MIGFGKTISDALNAGFDSGWVQPFITALEGLIVTYGLYKATIATTSAVQTASYRLEIAELDQLIATQQAKIEVDLQENVNKGERSCGCGSCCGYRCTS